MMTSDSLYQFLYHKAVQLLAQRCHSSTELKQKLKLVCQKKYPDILYENVDTQINKVINYCSLHRWIDDENYINLYIQMRARKGYGKQRIIAELKQKNLTDEMILTIVNKHNINWIEIGLTQIRKKYKNLNLNDIQQKAKIFRFLSYRGFKQDEISLIYSSL